MGGDASVSAGPVGRESSASTDLTFKSEVYSYSRSRGVFAGIAIDGSVISIDDDENDAFYRKKDVTAADIVSGAVTTNDDAARRFLTAVTTSTRGAAVGFRGAPPSASAAPVPQPAAARRTPAAEPPVERCAVLPGGRHAPGPGAHAAVGR